MVQKTLFNNVIYNCWAVAPFLAVNYCLTDNGSKAILSRPYTSNYFALCTANGNSKNEKEHELTDF